MYNPEKITDAKFFFRDIPENLKKKEWEGIPEGYVSVVHFTKPGALQGISEKGLRHYSEIISKADLNNYQKLKISMDKMFDQVATELKIAYKRGESIYASPSHTAEEQKMGKGDILLEMKVDPQKVIMSDGSLVTAAGMSWLRTSDGKKWLADNPDFIEEKDKDRFTKLHEEFKNDYLDYIRDYWRQAITLDEWNQLSEEEKSKLFKLPEIIIEGGVAPEFIRVRDG